MRFRFFSGIIFVLLMFNVTTNSSYIFADVDNSDSMFLSYNDQLDQFQTNASGRGWACSNNYCLAQSFKPTLPILTRVELFCWRVGSPEALKVSIFKELTEAPLASVVIDGDDIQPYTSEWTEFDFENITITPYETYYIVWNQSDGDMNNTCIWSYGGDNPYKNGLPWHHNGNEWENWENSSSEYGFHQIDFCFKTYGLEIEENHPPEAPVITGVTSGKIGEEYEYTFVAVDPDGDDIYLWIEWGDACPAEEWLGPFTSGEEIILTYSWETKGTYAVRALAKDVFDLQGEWASIDVNIPYYRMPFRDFLQRCITFFIEWLSLH